MAWSKMKKEETKPILILSRLIDDLKVKVEVNYITRLGSSKSGKVRPIKVVFANEKEKESVIESLPALKDYQQYKKISIMEDFTFEERKLIRFWADKATAKNSKEPDGSTVIWRVRGSPKNVLFLKKFEKNRHPQTKLYPRMEQKK